MNRPAADEAAPDNFHWKARIRRKVAGGGPFVERGHSGDVAMAGNRVRILQRNAERSAAFFGVPTRQVVEFGTEIEI
jgi:hypothetical protein